MPTKTDVRIAGLAVAYWLRRGFDFLKNREWALTVAFLATLLANAEAVLDIISGEIERAGGNFDPTTLLIIVAGVVTRLRVWAPASVDDEVAWLSNGNRALHDLLDEDDVFIDRLEARIAELEAATPSNEIEDVEAIWKSLLADAESGALESEPEDVAYAAGDDPFRPFGPNEWVETLADMPVSNSARFTIDSDGEVTDNGGNS